MGNEAVKIDATQGKEILRALRDLLKVQSDPARRFEIQSCIDQVTAELHVTAFELKSPDLKIERIRQALLGRRDENIELGIAPRDNTFDSKLLGVFGEELCVSLTGADRAARVNETDWDLKTKEGKRIQVKTRAVYEHNKDLIHIDFKTLDFDVLFLVLVDTKMEFKLKTFIPVEQLQKLVKDRNDNSFRLESIRTKYSEYKRYGRDSL